MPTSQSRSRSRVNKSTFGTFEERGYVFKNIATQTQNPDTLRSSKYVPTSYEEETMQDVITHKFVTRMRSGQIIASNMDQMRKVLTTDYRQSLVDSGFSHDGKPPAWNATYVTFTPAWEMDDIMNAPGVSYNPPSLTVLKGQVLAAARAKAANPQMQGITTLAEMHKTTKLIGDMGWRLVRLATCQQQLFAALKAGKLRNFKRMAKGSPSYRKKVASKSLKRLANEWLQYRYGLRQLVFDIQSAANAAKALKNTRVRYTARGQADTYLSETGGETSSPTFWGVNNYAKSIYRHNATVEAGVLVDPTVYGIPAIDAYGLAHPLSTAWELTKFSFVIDWFLNVGEVLRSADLALQNRVLTQWVTTRTKETYRREFQFRVQPNWEEQRWNTSVSWRTGFTYHNVNSPLSVAHVYVYRTKREIDPILPLGLNLKVDLNLGRILDSAALVSQAFGRYYRS